VGNPNDGAEIAEKVRKGKEDSCTHSLSSETSTVLKVSLHAGFSNCYSLGGVLRALLVWDYGLGWMDA